MIQSQARLQINNSRWIINLNQRNILPFNKSALSVKAIFETSPRFSQKIRMGRTGAYAFVGYSTFYKRCYKQLLLSCIYCQTLMSLFQQSYRQDPNQLSIQQTIFGIVLAFFGAHSLYFLNRNRILVYVLLSVILGMFLGTLIAIKQIKFYSVYVDPASGSSDLTPAEPTEWYNKFFASFGINICLILISLISAIGFCCVRHCLYVRHEQENAAYRIMVSNDQIMDQIIGSSESIIRSMRGSRMNSRVAGGLKFRDTVKAADKVEQDQTGLRIGQNARTMKKSQQDKKSMSMRIDQPVIQQREMSDNRIQGVFAGTESVYHLYKSECARSVQQEL